MFGTRPPHNRGTREPAAPSAPATGQVAPAENSTDEHRLTPVSTVGTVTVRYFAGARAAAGIREEILPVGTLQEIVSTLEQRHGARLGRVLAVASFLVDGIAWHDRAAPLPAGATVDVLPPFAGG